MDMGLLTETLEHRLGVAETGGIVQYRTLILDTYDVIGGSEFALTKYVL